MAEAYDAVVVGSGPNGLAAAITLARAGRLVLVIEGRDTVGGGMRTAELTLPGFRHDICSAVHPLGLASPFFRSLPLEAHGLRWIQPDAPLTHPLDQGEAVVLDRSFDATAAYLGRDGAAWRGFLQPLAAAWEDLLPDLLGPLRLPRHPLLYARFGAGALLPADTLARVWFRGRRARALFAGLAAHSIMSLQRSLTAAYGLTMGLLAHGVGWPIPAGGSQSIADALAAYLRSLGGEIRTGWWVRSLAELPPARATLFDITPRDLVKIAGDALPAGYRRTLRRYRYGPGVFKLDYALDGPIPWRNPAVARGGTVHVGGTLEEIVASEREAWQGRHTARPFVLVIQPSLFDPSRAPAGQHTAWTYCHVPNGSTVDMSAAIEGQIERFAPGFRDRILARSAMNTAQYEQYNPNYVGGDINSGVQDLFQHFTRPAVRISPYTTPNPRLFLCSSATPPGGGVHGMCGYWAAQAALRA